MNAAEFLGGRPVDDGGWRFAIGSELHGAFGGAFGGVVAAAALIAARGLAPGRVPVALDCHFLRGLLAGEATVTPTLVHHGRSLSAVAVDVHDERGRRTTRTTISLVAPEALVDLDRAGESSAGGWPAYEDGTDWQSPTGTAIGILASLRPRLVGRDERGIATALLVPWDDADASAEAACLAADICVGPPVATAFPGRWIPHPNPDLSLRFTGSGRSDRLVGVGRLERIAAGVAAVRIEVRAGEDLVAVGVSSSLLLATG